MKLRSALVKVTVENTKGREYEIPGVYWGDGTIRVNNPRPTKYKAKFLYTEPDIFDETDPKRLYWLDDEDSKVGELSSFRVKFMFLVLKPVKKRSRKSS